MDEKLAVPSSRWCITRIPRKRSTNHYKLPDAVDPTRDGPGHHLPLLRIATRLESAAGRGPEIPAGLSVEHQQQNVEENFMLGAVCALLALFLPFCIDLQSTASGCGSGAGLGFRAPIAAKRTSSPAASGYRGCNHFDESS